MTYTSPTTGEPVNRIWQLPTSVDELRQRRGAIQRWAEESFGFMGRTPDHVAGFFAGYAAAPEVLARDGNEKFADNAVKIYEFLRDNDVYIAYTIVPPQIDRSKPAHQQNPPDLYAGIVEERDDGVIIKGAQMLGTGAVFADYIHLSSIHPLRPGDENHAVSFDRSGKRTRCEDTLAALLFRGGIQHFRLPTGVAIRRDRRARRLQQRIRAVGAYLRLQEHPALPRSMVRDAGAYPRQQPGTNSFRHETEVPDGPRQAHHRDEWSVADPARARFNRGDRGSVRMYEGLLEAQIANAKPNANGIYIPDAQTHYAAMVLQSKIYPELLNMIRDLAGGGMIQLPSNVADFDNPETGEDIRRYVQSPDVPAEDRVKLLKLAWDAVGSEFAGRHDQYEKFYAGAPFIVKQRFLWNFDFETPPADR